MKGSTQVNEVQIALQLYTVRDQTQRDFAGTIQQVAAMGYAGVEFAGFGGLSARSMHDLLNETGLQAVGTHNSLTELQGERLGASLAYCKEIDCPTLVLAWLDPAQREIKNLPELAASLNAIGQRCAEAGITFGYHNHDAEFAMVDGRTWFDHLLDATDPNLVKIELDVGWVAYAAYDPLTLLQRLGERIALIHFKDRNTDGSVTEVGHGTLDMRGITNFARQHGVRAVVEQDEPTLLSLESARISLEYFHSAR